MKFKIRNFIFFAADLIFPAACLKCGRTNQWLCEACLRTLPVSSVLYCPYCGQISSYGRLCPACRQKSSLDGLIAALDYGHPLAERLIKTFKYRFVREIAEQLGRFLLLAYGEQSKKALFFKDACEEAAPDMLTAASNVLIMPVPLHQRRLRWRGFNQAASLALEFAKQANIAYEDKFLRRVRYTSSQTTLSSKERYENLKGSFSWSGHNLNGQDIILVDDVATSGATLEACAKVLKAVGAGEVWGLVAARGRRNFDSHGHYNGMAKI